jgi:hypothetical protein
MKRVFFLLNAAFAMATLDLISRVHLASLLGMFRYFRLSRGFHVRGLTGRVTEDGQSHRKGNTERG